MQAVRAAVDRARPGWRPIYVEWQGVDRDRGPALAAAATEQQRRPQNGAAAPGGGRAQPGASAAGDAAGGNGPMDRHRIRLRLEVYVPRT